MKIWRVDTVRGPLAKSWMWKRNEIGQQRLRWPIKLYNRAFDWFSSKRSGIPTTTFHFSPKGDELDR